MTKILFWKSVGGYLLAVKLGGRWHYVGSTGAEDVAFHFFMKDRGFSLDRVQGMPKVLSKIWNEKGATVTALKQSLPFWMDHFSKERSDEIRPKSLTH